MAISGLLIIKDIVHKVYEPLHQPRNSMASSGWDQVLNPLLQKQRANYSYHAQQVQIGSASAGSGWTGDNMECDCGEDSCPRCNLMLNMGMD